MLVEEVVRRKYGVRDFAEARRIGMAFYEARQALLADHVFSAEAGALAFLRLLSSAGCALGGYTRLSKEWLPSMLEVRVKLFLYGTKDELRN